MHLFLSLNNDTVIECSCSEVYSKGSYLFYERSDDGKIHSVLLSDIHYFNISTSFE